MDFSDRLPHWVSRVNTALDSWLPADTTPPTHLHAAMRYSVLTGGKRLRAILIYGTGELIGTAEQRLDATAAAVEMIHAYSLVHDDLPAMDNDDLRRGKPTCHKAFDEATAILAGDALQVLAFDVLTTDTELAVTDKTRLQMLNLLAQASGSRGMAGGQALDLAAEGTLPDAAALEKIHAHKTGALIRASVLLAAMTADLNQEQYDALDTYGQCVGLAFQIHDDILDIEGDTTTLGKPSGSDSRRAQPTFPSVLGLEAARLRAKNLHEEACAALATFGRKADRLRWLSEQVVSRKS
ncbi:MAG TPA: farnesyl diphosphate synthase [Gammaproteobacteria bacterium]|nr:farnesyl diphosphate synthase [Gammaproteobacteria bacterium]